VALSFLFWYSKFPNGAEELYIYRDMYIWSCISVEDRAGASPMSTKNYRLGYKLVVRFSGFAPAKLDVGLGK
jgi:hypothetical protein